MIYFRGAAKLLALFKTPCPMRVVYGSCGPVPRTPAPAAAPRSDLAGREFESHRSARSPCPPLRRCIGDCCIWTSIVTLSIPVQTADTNTAKKYGEKCRKCIFLARIVTSGTRPWDLSQDLGKWTRTLGSWEMGEGSWDLGPGCPNGNFGINKIKNQEK